MMNLPLTDKTARELSRHIVKNSQDVIVQQGKTNGEIVLHVKSTKLKQSRTIKSLGEWEDHPANDKTKRDNRAKKDEANA